jgi:membrane dipeptidase
VERCNELGIMIDLSHITERGFWDVAELSRAPLVATHSNAHAVCPSPRNLTDEQLEAVAASDGMVGLNFAVGFLDPDGGHDAAIGLDVMVRHIDHLVDKLGITRVGLGSDFDGARIPAAVGDVAGVQHLLEALSEHGYDDDALRKIAYQNWLRVLRNTWKG